MKYYLSVDAIEKLPEIELDKETFCRIRRATEILGNALEFEQKYDILIDNYIDFEKEILNMTTDFVIRRKLSYEYLYYDIRMLNRRLINLLTSTKLYIDQSFQNVNKSLPKYALDSSLKMIFSEEYEKHIEYRFMEELRNHVQHRGLPVHLLQKHVSRPPENKNCSEFRIKVVCKRQELIMDGRFKKRVLSEIDEQTDLVISVRQYIESLSKIHNQLRNAISQSVDTSRKEIEAAQKKIAKKNTAITESVYIYEKSKNAVVKKIPLLLNWDNVRVELQKQNKELSNLKNRYVTSLALV